jgi:hypothetical protein
MVALAEPNQIAGCGKFRYEGVLLEATYLRADQFALADLVLGDLDLVSPDDVWRRGAEVERFSGEEARRDSAADVEVQASIAV